MISVFNPRPARSGEQPLIFLKVTDATLKETLNQVSKISGYRIESQGEWHDLSVTVLIANLPLEKAILKILNNRINYMIIWNDKEKKISIMGVGISKNGKKDNGFRNLKKPPVRRNTGTTRQKIPLNGQNTRFEQASRTTHY